MTVFFEKSYKNTRTKKADTHLGICFFDCRGVQTISFGSPVDGAKPKRNEALPAQGGETDEKQISIRVSAFFIAKAGTICYNVCIMA